MIRVGGATAVVLNERMRRTQGALDARPRRRCPRASSPAAARRCCAAAPALDVLSQEGEYGRGVDVVRTVLSEPLYWIASNAGYDGQATIDQVRAMPDGHGLDTSPPASSPATRRSR